MLNEVKFIGNLTKDVELRHTDSGKPVVNLDLALNYYVGNEKKTEYVQVVLWEKRAEDAAKYLSKGRQVFVEAKVIVRKRTFEGKNIPIPEFHADRVGYLGTTNNQNNDPRNDSYPDDQHYGNHSYSQHTSSPFGNQGGSGNFISPFGR